MDYDEFMDQELECLRGQNASLLQQIEELKKERVCGNCVKFKSVYCEVKHLERLKIGGGINHKEICAKQSDPPCELWKFCRGE